MSWFLESWSVPEGCAFAVHRNYTLNGAMRSYLDPPDHVIYVCPPHFVPTPAGYATALAAARARFQEKFVDEHGEEVAFDTLEQVIELVRRAYLAAGAGGAPAPDGAPRPKEPTPALDPSQTLNDPEAKRFGEALRRLRTARLPKERNDTAQYLTSIWTIAASDALKQFCHAVVDAMIAEASLRLAQPMASESALLERDIRDFALLGIEMNEWNGWHEGSAFLRSTLDRLGAAVNGPFAENGPPCWPMATTDGLSRALASGLLHRLPSPLAWHPYRQLARLGDHLAAATSDRAYLKSMTSFEQALPVLTCSLALSAAESYRFRTGGPFRDASLIRQRAFAWLTRELPDDRLDAIPMADTAIRQVLDAATSTTGRSTL
jgi:hypothetical protein